MGNRLRARSVRGLRRVLALFVGLAAFTPGIAGNRPIHFEPVRGDGFTSRGRGYALHLDSGEAVLLTGEGVVRMRLVGATADAPGEGIDLLPGKSHYLIGRDPAKWRRNVAQYARVRYGDVYRG